MSIDLATYRLRDVERVAKSAAAAHQRAAKWDDELYAAMRKAAADGASLAQIATAAGCSKTWAKRCVDAKPGERP